MSLNSFYAIFTSEPTIFRIIFSSLREECSYDAVGNVASITDELGNITYFEYTLTNKISKMIDTLGNETCYSYNEIDQLIEVCQNVGVKDDESSARITTYKRNLLGQIKSITDALGQKEHYFYCPKGQLVEKIDKEGYSTKYGHTTLGDINYIQYADGREVTFGYNPLRQLTEVKDWLGITNIEVDKLGRATKVSNHNNDIISYSYGKLGERRSITYPDGKIIEYDYDEHLNLIEINDGSQSITYHYDADWALIEKRFGDNAKTEYGYDDLGRLQELTHYDDKKQLDKLHYEYDLAGNKIQIKKFCKGFDEENGSFYYKYDELNRLDRMGRNGQYPTREYKYDAFGNRISKIEGRNTTTYTYNSLNQLISSVDTNGVNHDYSYDKRGNLIELYKNKQLINKYKFGMLNRLEKTFNHENNQSVSYKYNGLNKRVGSVYSTFPDSALPDERLNEEGLNPTKQIDDVLDLTRDFHNLLQRNEKHIEQTGVDFNKDAKSITRFVYDFGVLSAQSEGCESHNYLLDDLGSPLRVLGRDMNELYHYDEFGVPIVPENRKFRGLNKASSKQPFGFTGYRMDDIEITGTNFAQAREYKSEIGRFTAQDTHWHTGNLFYGDLDTYEDYEKVIGPDPSAIRQSNNLYEYVLNDPLNSVDLNGECKFIIRGARRVVQWAAGGAAAAAPVVNENQTTIDKIINWLDRVERAATSILIVFPTTIVVDAGLQVLDNWLSEEPLFNINIFSSILNGFLSIPVAGMAGWGSSLWKIVATAGGIAGARDVVRQLLGGDGFNWRRLAEVISLDALFALFGGNTFNLQAIPTEIINAILSEIIQGGVERREEISALIREMLDNDDCPFSDSAPPQLPPSELLPYLPTFA